MTIINPNSIAGITSVTAEAGVMNFYKSDGTLAGLQLNGVNFNTTSGISTFNNVYVGGTITYEDVKNVDSVGIITARDHINIVTDNKKLQVGAGQDLTLYHDGNNSIIKNITGNLYINPNNTQTGILLVGSTGAVTLYHGGNLKFETEATGAKVTGDITISDKIIHAGDTNTAIRFPADDTVSVETAGSERMRFTSGGAVLIKATSTSNAETFRIHEADSGKVIIKLTNATTGTAAGDGFEFGLNASEQIEFVNKENTDMFFATNNTERLRIDSTGRVLVGTTAGWGSNVKLHLASSGNTYATITSGTSSNGVLAFSDDGTERGSIDYDHNGDHMLFKTAAAERLRIKSDGNIGIGTNTATSKLEIFAPPLNATTVNSTTCKQLGLWINPSGTGNNTTGNIYNGIALSDGFAGLYGYDDGSSAATGLGFFTGNASAVAERLRITSGGATEVKGDLYVKTTYPRIYLTDTNSNSDWSIINDNGTFSVYDDTVSGFRLRIDTSGNIGQGVTPSGWASAQAGDFYAYQVGTGAALFGRGSGDEDRGGISVNYYHTGSAEKYIGNGNAVKIYMADGNIHFSNAAANSSGAGAAMTLNETLRIKSDGNVKIFNHLAVDKSFETLTGNGVNAKLQVNVGTNDYDGIMLGGGYNRSTITTGGTYDLVLTSNAYPANATSNGIRFLCGSSGGGGPTERMRISPEGKVGINYAATPPSEDLMVRGAGSTGGVTIQHLSSGNSYGARLSSRGGSNQGLILGTQFNSTYSDKILMNGNGQVTFSTDGQISAGNPNLIMTLVCAGNHSSSGVYPGLGIRSTHSGGTSGSYIWTTDDNWGIKTNCGIAGLAFAPQGHNASSAQARMYIGSDGIVTVGPDTYNKINTRAHCGAALGVAGGGVSIGPKGTNTACREPGRYVKGWYMVDDTGDSYWHLKTDMWAGGSPHGNNEWIMGGFHIHSYRYNTSGISHEIHYFHNWSGGYANYDIEHWGSWNAGSLVYTSSDGFVTLRVAGGTYVGHIIDYVQHAWYTNRTTQVTSATSSNSSTI